MTQLLDLDTVSIIKEHRIADVAQLVEQHFCKVKVVGSIPAIGSRIRLSDF